MLGGARLFASTIFMFCFLLACVQQVKIQKDLPTTYLCSVDLSTHPLSKPSEHFESEFHASLDVFLVSSDLCSLGANKETSADLRIIFDARWNDHVCVLDSILNSWRTGLFWRLFRRGRSVLPMADRSVL